MFQSRIFNGMQDSGLNFSSPVSGMQLCSGIKVAKPSFLSNRMTIRWHSMQALWDTGAVTSGISREMASRIGLEPRERAILATAAGSVVTEKDIILLNLLIDDCVMPVKVAVVDSIPGVGNDFLIGMDIIQCGDLSISSDHPNGLFYVRFTPYPGLFRTGEDLFLK